MAEILPVEGLAPPVAGYELTRLEPDRQVEAAALVRRVMAEFGRTGTGCSCNDPEMEALASAYQQADRFFLALLGPAGNLVGTAGVAPLQGAPPEQKVCELRKMYFTPEVRGLGLGRWLLSQCLAGARRLGYRRVYLETCEGMHAAIRLYQRNGFRRLDGPMGSTGHSGACSLYFAIEL